MSFNNEKKAITSLILGILSMTPLWLVGFAIISGIIFSASRPIYIYGEALGRLVSYATTPGISIISFGSGVAGLIFGIISLKSAKKKFAISGIILSLIGLMLFILHLWIYGGISY